MLSREAGKHGTASDSSTLTESLGKATKNLDRSGAECRINEVVADKGYRAVETLAECVEIGYRTYISERKPSSKSGQHKWTDKTAEQLRAIGSTTTTCSETGGSRRSSLIGFRKVRKRYSMAAAARNLGLVMRAVFGIGKPRVLQDGLRAIGRLLDSVARCLICAIRGCHANQLAVAA